MFDTPAPKPGILVVDDEPFVLDVIEHLLRHHGFEVWPAGGGAEALALYQRHRDAVALVLLDVQMPGLDGPQTLRALRALNPDVRCCFMSAFPGRYSLAELRDLGVAHFFPKPFRMTPLVEQIRELTGAGPALVRPRAAHS